MLQIEEQFEAYQNHYSIHDILEYLSLHNDRLIGVFHVSAHIAAVILLLKIWPYEKYHYGGI